MARKWNDEQLKEAVANSFSMADVMRFLNLTVSGGTFALVKLRIKQLELSTFHFVKRGCQKENQERLANFNKQRKQKTEDILVKDSTYASTHALKLRLLKEGLLLEKCYICEMQPIWQNKRLSLQLDHIDGDRCNNELSNLRILCPNCHSQTNTFTGKNKRRSDKTSGHVLLGACCDCNMKISVVATRCNSCAKKMQTTKIIWPTNQNLLNMLENSSYSAIARELGVSDNAIRKRLKNHKDMLQ